MQDTRASNRTGGYSVDLAERLASRLIGQTEAINEIVPFVQMFEAELSPDRRPVGVFLLLGPTGTGKTKTVEALAHELHGSEKSLLRIDCAEFQMEHEVAKLIGAPPGYLGHRETHPMITQQKLQSTTSEHCDLSLVLFDEIEKAAPSMCRLLLGILDKALLHLGDNSTVNFENSLIFFTSNLGARNMQDHINPRFGFGNSEEHAALPEKLKRAAMTAVRQHFSPEFVNRIDSFATYRPLTAEHVSTILDLELKELQKHISSRLGDRRFRLTVEESAREILVRLGTSAEFGARELKRTIHRCLVQPLAARAAQGAIPAYSAVVVRSREDQLEFVLPQSKSARRQTAAARLSDLRLSA
jgi:ATP-dependent Clp protease ATP-binding subunit ClpA